MYIHKISVITFQPNVPSNHSLWAPTGASNGPWQSAKALTKIRVMDFIYKSISSSPLFSGVSLCPLFVVFHHWIRVAQFNTHPPSHKHLDWIPLYLECTVDCKNVIYIFINMPTVNKICILVASSFFSYSERLFPFTVRTFTLREPGSNTGMCPLMDPGRLLAQSTHRILHCAVLGENTQHHQHVIPQMYVHRATLSGFETTCK